MKIQLQRSFDQQDQRAENSERNCRAVSNDVNRGNASSACAGLPAHRPYWHEAQANYERFVLGVKAVNQSSN
jgi:hypothetical protein